MNSRLYWLERIACAFVISAALPTGRALARESNSTPFAVVFKISPN